MDEKGNWTVSPAYDLTFSSGPAGQQSMLVAGEGENPGILDLLKLAPLADYSEADARRVIERIQDVLSDWPSLAKKFEVSAENVQLISKRLGTHFN
jgi:serine/threonine-protein kinase HipA